jgi:thiol-disulfide isomerase/thioredoxin
MPMKITAALFWLSYLCCSSGTVVAADYQNDVLAPHAPDLVVLQGKKLVPFKSASFLSARYLVLFFSAGWCSDSRAFCPALVKAYNHQPAGGSRYEVVLVSRDKDATGMLKYMKRQHMPWPALAFEKVPEAKDLANLYSTRGIPCLTVLNSKGTVVLQSKSDQDANEVLQQLVKLVSHDGQK